MASNTSFDGALFDATSYNRGGLDLNINQIELKNERKILVQRVIEGILDSEKGKSDFKSRLVQLLEEHAL